MKIKFRIANNISMMITLVWKFFDRIAQCENEIKYLIV